MNKKLKTRIILLNENRGTVQFAETDKDRKIIMTVTIVFADPKEAAKFEHGKEYTINVSPSK